MTGLFSMLRVLTRNHTQEIAAPSFEQGEEAFFAPYEQVSGEAISITEHYRETKSRFTWIGEIEDEPAAVCA